MVEHEFGEMQVCDIHRAGFLRDIGEHDVRVWPLAEYRALTREG
jgi:hypothetical protein